MSAVIAHIDLAALKSNYSVARKLSPESKNFAVIKADGYGHGSVSCARALNQADGFAVATVEEAIQLRQQDIKHPLLILSRFSCQDEVALIAHFDLMPVIHSHYQLDLLLAGDTYKIPINVWLKIDTGMNRLGLNADELIAMIERIDNTKQIEISGLMSHLACSDETENEFTDIQLQRFNQLTANADLPLSIANSAAIMAWPQTHMHWNRPGIMLYGASPLSQDDLSQVTLVPVMNLTSTLVSTAILKKGQGIGYAHTFVADKDIRVGIVACGYADGYPRSACTGTPVLVCNQRCGLLGRVSMDTLAVDLTSVPQAQAGSPVELWGSNLHVSEVARHAGTISYELLTRVTQRVPRQYINGPSNTS